MSPALPVGEPVPVDGSLPHWLGGTAAHTPFGVYIHVPFCRVRCGYCDFNTYTSTELGGGGDMAHYPVAARAEMDLAVRAMADAGIPLRPAQTVFFGGGTPTMLPAPALAGLLDAVRQVWGLAPDAEVTTEANPETVDQVYLDALAAAGFTRVSFGMQSAVPHVLATLERTHTPQRVPQVVRWAQDAGLETSLDLIYGTPGESLADWRTSLDAAIACAPDHISAYALTVEPGTKLAAQVRRGQVAAVDPDDQADKYELADAILADGGYQWYEISNWARQDGAGRPMVCRHNLGYWNGSDWWGIGPGAHSHLAAAQPQAGPSAGETGSVDGEPRGLRWWNVKHPRAYAQALAAGHSPGAGREILTAADDALETTMLAVRLREGIGVDTLPSVSRREIAGLIADGLVDGRAALAGRVCLTLRGRLLADRVVDLLT